MTVSILVISQQRVHEKDLSPFSQPEGGTVQPQFSVPVILDFSIDVSATGGRMFRLSQIIALSDVSHHANATMNAAIIQTTKSRLKCMAANELILF